MNKRISRSTLALLGAALFAAALLAVGCGADGERAVERTGEQAGERTRNRGDDRGSRGPIVLISIDTLRSDRLPAYGYGGVETPHLDRLRKDSVLFERAYSPVPLTTPAHASIMTGRLPPDHGLRDNAGYRIRDEHPTLAEILAEAGYRTGGTVSSFTLRKATGMDRGFEHYDDEIDRGSRLSLAEVQRAGDQSVDALMPWLREVATGGQPFFAFVHIYEPHTPYTPPPPYDRYADPYDGEIAKSDAIVGRLLDSLSDLGVYDRSTVIVLSDHGEGLGDHGEPEHGILLYREALQVPLIIKLPGARRAGTSVATPVSLTDVAPTVLALAGIDPSKLDDIDGRDLLAMSGDDGDGRGIYGESFHGQLRYGWAGLTSWIEGRWHLIAGPDPELYDLIADPGERNNVLLDERRVYARMNAALESVANEPEPPGAIDEETRRKLESLGYLGSSRPTSRDLPDPKSQLATLEPLQDGVQALSEGDHERAIPLLRQAIAINERFEAAWGHLGLALEELERFDEAFDAYKRAFDLSQASAPEVVDALLRLSIRLGRLEDVSTFVPLAIANHPDDIELRFLATRVLLLQRRFDEALVAAEATLERAPDRPDAHYQLGAAAMGAGQLEIAERHFLEAIGSPRGTFPPALQDLAILYLSQSRRSEARRLLERLVELQPDNQAAREQLDRLRADPTAQ